MIKDCGLSAWKNGGGALGSYIKVWQVRSIVPLTQLRGTLTVARIWNMSELVHSVWCGQHVLHTMWIYVVSIPLISSGHVLLICMRRILLLLFWLQFESRAARCQLCFLLSTLAPFISFPAW